MCGIVGVWNFHGPPVGQDLIDIFTDTQSHRGPDGRGTYQDTAACLALGHRRLAIFDTSERANQPLSYANGRYWITYNGEIFNFPELRKNLENNGYRFVTESDTEVILAAYDLWGEECQQKFNGMWAFAIWDTREHTLFLSRDRFGVKPLHYLYDADHFAFASEMKAFLALDWFEAEFDPEVVALALTEYWKIEGMERCLLKGIKRLPGGHCMRVHRDSNIEIRRWWNTLEHLESVPACYPDQVARFRELFLDACRIRMRSDVSLGTSLSGGLDSSSALCSMKYISDNAGSFCQDRLPGIWQKAFIALYPDNPDDERSYADLVVRHSGIQPVYCQVKPDDLIHYFQDIIFKYEEISDIHIGPWRVYEAQRASNIVVSVDGHGGDELLAGYPEYVRTLIFESIFPIPSIEKTKSLIKIFQGMLSPESSYHLPPVSKIYYERIVFTLLKVRMLFINKFSRIFENTNKNNSQGKSWLLITPLKFSSSALASDKKKLSGHDTLFRQLYEDFHYYLLPTNLRDFDRLSMAHGVEVRSPFLDWRLVCFTFSLPSESKVGDGYTKRILRDAMKGILPEPIRTRTIKGGFANPGGDWLFNAAHDLIITTIDEEEFINSRIWDGKQISKDVKTAFANQDYAIISRVWIYIQAMHLIKSFQNKKAFYKEIKTH